MDDVDFSTLAARMMAGLDGVRACLILSSDGLTMGIYPDSGEARARAAWDRLQELGDPQRGFIDIGEELWVFVRGGPYAGVLLTRPGVRPGLLIDKLEFLLRAAEEARARETTEINAASSGRPEATRRPRTSLHAESKQAPAAPARSPAPPPTPPGPARASADRSPGYKAPPILSGAAKKVVDVTAEGGDGSDVADDIAGPPALELGPAPESLSAAAREIDELARPDRTPVAASAPSSTEPAPSATKGRTSAPRPAAPPSSPAPAVGRTGAPDVASPPSASLDAEVDRVALAREFGRLLAEGGADGDR